jgi:carboxylate-amine ligase
MSFAPASRLKFGLETEYLVVRLSDWKPLWHTELSFDEIYPVLESIPLEGILPLDGLELEPPHRKMLPYVVEGYHLPHQDHEAESMLPKGIEIRTPVTDSLETCFAQQRILLDRLQSALSTKNLGVVALSHHPLHHRFRGPQNKRRHDFWLWAMEVMTTYGPDLNVGLPAEWFEKIDQEDLLEKINYYGPAMTALSVAAPFRDGGLWEIRGATGLSLRTYRRSVIAPPIEIHPHENHRLEFKVFDMTPNFDELRSYFGLFIGMLASDRLKGRASNATRIYDSGAVGLTGLRTPEIGARLNELIEASRAVLPEFGLDPEILSPAEARLRSRRTPAEDLIGLFERSGRKLEPVLEELYRATCEGRSLRTHG